MDDPRTLSVTEWFAVFSAWSARASALRNEISGHLDDLGLEPDGMVALEVLPAALGAELQAVRVSMAQVAEEAHLQLVAPPEEPGADPKRAANVQFGRVYTAMSTVSYTMRLLNDVADRGVTREIYQLRDEQLDMMYSLGLLWDLLERS